MTLVSVHGTRLHKAMCIYPWRNTLTRAVHTIRMQDLTAGSVYCGALSGWCGHGKGKPLVACSDSGTNNPMRCVASVLAPQAQARGRR
jgi:hypothetical protein